MKSKKSFTLVSYMLLIVFTINAQQTNIANIYKVSVCEIYLSEASENNSSLYGNIGIQVQVKRDKNLVTLPNQEHTTTRFWNVNTKEAKKISTKIIGCIVDPTGVRFHYNSSLEVSEWRSFYISESDYINNASLNIRANLACINTVNTHTFSWKQRNLFIKNMLLGKEYLLIQKASENSNSKVAITFKIQKIN